MKSNNEESIVQKKIVHSDRVWKSNEESQ